MASLNEQMFQAAHDGNVALVARLLDEGADPKATDAHGETPLEIAADLGHDEVAMFLANHGGGTVAAAYAHRAAERRNALALLNLSEREVTQRIKACECLVCAKPMDYVRFYVQRKHFCAAHEGAGAEMLHAIETLSAYLH